MAQELLRAALSPHGFGFWTTSTAVFLALLLAGRLQARRIRRNRITEARLRLETAWRTTVAGDPKAETILQTKVSCDI